MSKRLTLNSADEVVSYDVLVRGAAVPEVAFREINQWAREIHAYGDSETWQTTVEPVLNEMNQISADLRAVRRSSGQVVQFNAQSRVMVEQAVAALEGYEETVRFPEIFQHTPNLD